MAAKSAPTYDESGALYKTGQMWVKAIEARGIKIPADILETFQATTSREADAAGRMMAYK
jgi:hypothetical protein